MQLFVKDRKRACEKIFPIRHCAATNAQTFQWSAYACKDEISGLPLSLVCHGFAWPSGEELSQCLLGSRSTGRCGGGREGGRIRARRARSLTGVGGPRRKMAGRQLRG